MTIKQIANHLGLSATTVSNVIHGKTSEVSKETVERVRKYLEEVHYAPDINARNLAQNRSKIIGFVIKASSYRHVNVFTDSFVADLIGGVEGAIRAAGYFMMMYLSDDIEEILQYVSGWNIDGLVMFAPSDEDILRVNESYHKPVVFIDAYFLENTREHLENQFVNVGLDDEGAVHDAVQYLIGKGHREIAFISRNYLGVDMQRYRGFCRAKQEAGLPYGGSDFLVCHHEKEKHTYEKLARQASQFTAVIACSDATAILLGNALEDIGVHVPEDVSLIGFDDNASCIFARPALTTIRQDIPMKGRTAVQNLISMIEGKAPERHNILLPTQIVERDSVREIR